MRNRLFWTTLSASLLALAAAAQEVRIKDITEIQGMRDNQLSGIGIVTGLNGTGDGSEVTKQALVNLLKKENLNVSTNDVASGNVALVLVTATLPPGVRNGNKIDVTVTSIGDASSLKGGTLVQMPLKAANGTEYAVAQGQVSTGGFAAGGNAASVQKNHTTVGAIPSGAIVEREVPLNIVYNERNRSLLLTLKNPDFATAARIAEVINQKYKDAASAQDMKAVEVKIPKGFDENNLVGFVADFHALTVVPDAPSKVIINERTGTIVAGSYVRVSTVAITHGNLIITIAETPEISQPAPMSRGRTAILDRTDLNVTEEQSNFMVVDGNTSVADLAQALNAIGATPRDLVIIFQLIKKAGALHAELELM
jgi:flagellar P-ring protein precursor FlgI